jgi:hypothetical protein
MHQASDSDCRLQPIRMAPDDQTVSPEAAGIGCLMFGTLYGQAIAESDATRCQAKSAAVCVSIHRHYLG